MRTDVPACQQMLIIRADVCSYQNLLDWARVTGAQLLRLPAFLGWRSASDALTGPRVAIMTPPNGEHVASMWGTWLAGGVAVPLCPSHPDKQLAYVLEDSGASVVFVSRSHAERMQPIARAAGVTMRVILPAGGDLEGDLQQLPATRPRPLDYVSTRAALFVYTSGTTGAPKAAVHTHDSLRAQTAALKEAWDIVPWDRLLHALPLHHIHGAVAALLTAHSAGAAVEMLPRFSPAAVWESLMREEDPVTMFMGVPTMYSYMLQHFATMSPADQQRAQQAAQRLRVTVSGSAPLPVKLQQQWRDLSGQRLLERYGMTETGMLLSNPLYGRRRPGSVGHELPGVEACVEVEAETPLWQRQRQQTHRLKQTHRQPSDGPHIGDSGSGVRRYGDGGSGSGKVVPVESGPVKVLKWRAGRSMHLTRPRNLKLPYRGLGWKSAKKAADADTDETDQGLEDISQGGQLLVRGPGLFRGYWQRPEATAEAFTADGWFRTGDTAMLRGNPPAWTILGRTSVDMIKVGGHKVSALAVENAVGAHPGVKELAVLGLPHEQLGEQVAALVVLADGTLTAEALRDWAKAEIPDYQVPKVIKFVDELPRNAMGKVNKKALRTEYFDVK